MILAIEQNSAIFENLVSKIAEKVKIVKSK
jgi:hypothetical protein